MKNILDGRKDRRTEVKQYTPPPPLGSGGIMTKSIIGPVKKTKHYPWPDPNVYSLSLDVTN
jgi:hypothetical protein